jgi:molybdopterin synthase sulfur carrier subunit
VKEGTMPIVEVPPRYRGPTGGRSVVEVEADTVRSCIEAVEVAYPGFRELILGDDGTIRRFVRLFVNGDLLDREAVDTPVASTDHVQILAAAAGG